MPNKNQNAKSKRKPYSNLKASAVWRSKELLEGLREAVSQSLSDSWDGVKKEMRGEIYCALRGYDGASIEVIDGCSGEEWWQMPLAKLVTEYMEYDDPSCNEEVADWNDALAADFEKQAKRLRARAKALRASPSNEKS
jgi:hypothetical protein